jgi:hypothetical protein
MDDKPKTTFEDTVRAVGADVVDLLDGAVDGVTHAIGGENGNKLIGGAAVGALAAIVLPISLIGGALLGAGYAALRKSNR